MKKPITDGVTLAEAARIASKIMRRPVSPSQVRSILLLDTTGRALEPRQHGDTRLYTAFDIAEAVLTLLLRDEGVSATVARVIVANLRPLLEKHWAHNDPMAVAVIGLRGYVVPEITRRTSGVIAWVKLRDARKGIEDHVRVTREQEPDVKRWNRPVATAVGA